MVNHLRMRKTGIIILLGIFSVLSVWAEDVVYLTTEQFKARIYQIDFQFLWLLKRNQFKKRQH